MSTHNIPFSVEEENHPKLSQIYSYGIFFNGTQERVRNSHGNRAISVRAIEVLLYFVYHRISLPTASEQGLTYTPDQIHRLMKLNVKCKTLT